MEPETLYKVQVKCGCRWADCSVSTTRENTERALEHISTSNPAGTYRMVTANTPDAFSHLLPTEVL